jgi:hypothetical protein
MFRNLLPSAYKTKLGHGLHETEISILPLVLGNPTVLNEV